MSGLMSTLQATAKAIHVLDRAIGVTQNNVNNAQTPGYVRQRLDMASVTFDAERGQPGGVSVAGINNNRQDYTEQSVRGAASDEGFGKAQQTLLRLLESVFPPDATKGVSGALGGLWDAFSAWSAAPNSTVARQQVLSAATSVAGAFQSTAKQVKDLRQYADQQVGTSVRRINQLAATIAGLNNQIANGGMNPGLDANLHSALEELAGEVNISVLNKPDGSVTVLVGGQHPLVDGNVVSALQSVVTPQGAQSPPSLRIQATSGEDVTALTAGGKLGGLLNFRLGTLADVEGDGGQPGSLNTMAASIADRINQILSGGFTRMDPSPVAGQPLFQYSAAGTAAASLSVVPGLTGADLAAIAGGAQPDANGVARQLAALSTSTNPADQISGQTYADFYAGLSSSLGSLTAAAAEQTQFAEDAMLMARNLRQELAGVSLDEEAAMLLEYQRSYQANAKVVQVVADLTATLIDMVR
jgi:flagellar hook-associated protein 1 FlgK